MRVRKGLACTAVAVAMAVLGGCGSGGDAEKEPTRGDSAPKGEDESKAEDVPEAFDAPLKFEPAPEVTVPKAATSGNVAMSGRTDANGLPVTIEKGVLYIGRTDGLEIASGYRPSDAVLITTAESQPVDPEKDGPFVGDSTDAPHLTTVDGKRLAVMAVVGELPGSGTTPKKTVVELLAADAREATLAWSATVEFEGLQDYSKHSDGPPQILGQVGDTLVLEVGDHTLGVDLTTRERVWSTEADGVLAGDTLVVERAESAREDRLVGLDAATGEEKWSVDAEGYGDFVGATSNLVALESYSGGEGRLTFVETAEGKEVVTHRDRDQSACSYDGASVLVCGDGKRLDAYAADSGKPLWSLPDESANRVAPRMTLLREGLLYGTTENGPVVLDALTGADKETEPGAAPFVTDGIAALAFAPESKRAIAFRVTG
ncbi:PQQ-binding-like beta-propeller repeat protein [Streptomyces sp. JJ38]|uniref:outer membrane protein assembly factor BamB family protein n=1 Tax=Streptomyces sp. JJ38 TaxID=2738128 RepID=UPI001C586946|nr:PQQ-binding-like beta-propeller repeat protein [Streptomyces sp. JJ38]MBW1598943.1 PQQ-binding-like beta-propeller repeat protein [Streptomyces sp. JJ38]